MAVEEAGAQEDGVMLPKEGSEAAARRAAAQGVVPAVPIQGGARGCGAPDHRVRPPARALSPLHVGFFLHGSVAVQMKSVI